MSRNIVFLWICEMEISPELNTPNRAERVKKLFKKLNESLKWIPDKNPYTGKTKRKVEAKNMCTIRESNPGLELGRLIS